MRTVGTGAAGGPHLASGGRRLMRIRQRRLLVAVTVPATTAFLTGQLSWFRQQGYDVHLLASPGPLLDATGRTEGVTVHSVPMSRHINPAADLRALLRICRVLIRVRPDVISVGTPKAGLLVGVAAFLLRVPGRVYVLRGLRVEGVRGPTARLLSILERLACGVAHVVVCVSPSLREVVVGRGLVPLKKTRVVGTGSSNGVEPGRFARTPEREHSAAAIRAQLGIGPDDPVIGFVGRVTAEKGLAELVAAHGRLRQEMKPAPSLIVVGDPEGVKLDGLPGVHFIGPRSDVADCLPAMDILALPTHREGFPNVVLEAACAELPAVVTDATGARDSVVNGVTGLIVRTGDPEQLAAALRTLLTDQERRLEMGRAARRRAETSFRPVDVWTGLLAIYDEAIGGRALPGWGNPASSIWCRCADAVVDRQPAARVKKEQCAR